MADDDEAKFHWADYVVFGLSLAVSLGIGIFFAVVAYVKKNNTAEEFLLGSRGVHWIPAGMSLLVSILNAGFVIGVPAEIHYNGSYYCFSGIGMLIMLLVVTAVFLPVFQRIKLTSAYEYFDLRYQYKPLRMVVSLAFLLNMLFLLGVVLYIPALAVNEVTDISMAALIVSTGAVCTLYTTLGGIKAVVWTDLLQSIIMLAGMVVLAARGASKVGGATFILDSIKDGGRFDFMDTDPDPRVRHTFWTQTIGWGIIMISMFGSSQVSLQRYMAIGRQRNSVYALILVTVLGWLLLALVTITGYVMYTYYTYEKKCDPLLTGRITKPDQIVPRFLMDVMGDLHGLPGLFLASVFAAALSTVSSALNSMSGVILEDFIRPVLPMAARTAAWLSKGIALVLGGLTIGLSFAAEHMGERVVEIPATIWGALAAPILGAFVLALFVSWSTGFGVMCGTILGVSMGCWLSIGGVYEGAKPTVLFPLGTTCLPMWPPPPPPTSEKHALQDFYDISYTWYGLIALLTTVLSGLFFSFIHAACSRKSLKERMREVDRTLMFQSPWGLCNKGSQYTIRDGAELEGHSNPAIDFMEDNKPVTKA